MTIRINLRKIKEIIDNWWAPIVLLFLILLYGRDFVRWASLASIDTYTKYFNHPQTFDSQTTGQIGDTLGGTTAPYIGLTAIFITFVAFWVQFRANKQVQKQFAMQQFESQFYEMLRLHRLNVSEMKISGYEVLVSRTEETTDNNKKKSVTRSQSSKRTEGHKVFVTMSTELKCCYEFLEKYQADLGTNYAKKDLLGLAYRIFFFGSSSELISSARIDNSFIEHCQRELRKVRIAHKTSFSQNNVYPGLNKDIKLYIKYSPFTGHESRLGHYYRHLYSSVKFVVEKEKTGLFDYQKARDYLKLLRVQMSNDEQLMLYYNYSIGFGSDWEKREFLTKYRMLHNLPVNKVRYAEDPREHFAAFIKSNKTKKEDNLFEWGDYEA